jgi:hypothetical protein
MHLYAFGSVCRGEVTQGSDIDLLAVTAGHDSRFDPAIYSIYSYKRLAEIWDEGNPFAWHLFLESKMLHSDDGRDYLASLGTPSRYTWAARDCRKFAALFDRAHEAISVGTNSVVFELSTAFLAIRNYATCFSLGIGSHPDFSRSSALRLGARSLAIDREAYQILERARILCTRGNGDVISRSEVQLAQGQLHLVADWMIQLAEVVEANERI